MLRRISLLLAALSAVTIGVVVTTGPSPTVSADVRDVVPERVLDTRAGLGAPKGRLAPGSTLRLKLPQVSIDGDTAVILNLTGTGVQRRGFVTAWSCEDGKPTTSILNVLPGLAAPNAVVLPYTSGGICMSSTVPVHLIADLTGVTTRGEVRAVASERIYDSRSGNRLVAGREYRIPVAGEPGVASDAAAALLNITAVRPRTDGWAIVQPCGSKSTASTMNFRTDENVPHFTTTGLGGGDICVTTTADLDLIVDAFGWVPSSSKVEAVTPARLLDTRSGQGGKLGKVRDGDDIRLRVAGYAGVPNDAAAATINIVAVRGAASGFVSVRPCDQSSTKTSAINLYPGVLRANQITVTLPKSGELCIRTQIIDDSRLHLVVDAVGYVDGNISRPAPPPTTVPPPPSSHFSTLPVGATLPSGAECAARVRNAPEIRPENNAANSNRGGRAYANSRTDWGGFARVDGDFAGTTDEIIQWAACKWGIDEDIARAQIIKESYWYMSANGDGGDSWGLGQIRTSAHPSAFQYSKVNARNSSAYNLDYTYANWRGCYEGVYTWLNNVERNRTYAAGDVWGCVGLWFSGRWYVNNDAYLNQPGDSVRWHFENRTWETSGFING